MFVFHNILNNGFLLRMNTSLNPSNNLINASRSCTLNSSNNLINPPRSCEFSLRTITHKGLNVNPPSKMSQDPHKSSRDLINIGYESRRDT